MSWQSYVDTLMATKAMTSCGIFGLDGSTWAASAGFPVSALALLGLLLIDLFFKRIYYNFRSPQNTLN